MKKNSIIKVITFIVLLLIIFLYSLFGIFQNNNFNVIFNSTQSKTNCTIVNIGNGEVALFDCGDRASFDEVCSFLSTRNLYNVDYVFISTTDEEHIGRLNEFIKIYDIKEIFIAENDSADKTVELAYKSARENNVKIHYLKNNENIKIDEMNVSVLLTPESEDDEKVCGVFRIDYKDFSSVLLGSSSLFLQKYMLEEYPDFFEDTDIVCMAHSYNDDLTYPPLLEASDAKYGVYSVDKFNLLSQEFFKNSDMKLYSLEKESVVFTYKSEENTISISDTICRRQTSFKKATFVFVDKGDFFE